MQLTQAQKVEKANEDARQYGVSPMEFDDLVHYVEDILPNRSLRELGEELVRHGMELAIHMWNVDATVQKNAVLRELESRES